MKIYKTEINDGLSEAIEGDNSVALYCELSNSFLADDNFSDSDFQSIASLLHASQQGECSQEDLYYLNSVLVSAGWNKNDDVFTSEELWASRNTPRNKQFNFMHDETDIIGHIISCIVVDAQGNILDDEMEEEVPDKVDIITKSVIYKTWSDPILRARVQDLIKEIEEGKWAVSMECVFKNFDYAVITPSGEHKVLERNEQSAFLTKHLRAYGGTGEYEGYKIGRALKSLYFSGKGLVDNPANPRSIILSKDVDPFSSRDNVEITNFLTAMEKDMAKDNEVQSDLDAAKAEIETVKETLTKEKEDAVAEVTASFESQLAEKDELITSLEAKVQELDTSLTSATEAKTSLQKELDSTKSELRISVRKSDLIQAGVSEDRVSELLDQFANADDEMFKSVVALIVPDAPEPVQPVVEEEDEEAEAVESDLDEVVVEDEDVASASILEEEESELQQSMAAATDWLRTSVLKSTKNLKRG